MQFLVELSATDETGLRLFLEGLTPSSWYDYSEHVNAAGSDDGITDHLDDLQALDAAA